MKKGKTRLIILILIFAIFTIILAIIFWPFIQNLGDEEYREGLSNWIRSHGLSGVAVLFGLQFLQIFIAIIPGGPIQIIAGMAYGTWAGFAIIVAGCFFTKTIIFYIGKRFGLPFLRRFFGEDDLNTWKFLKDSKKVERVVFILFLIPGTPKDLLTWLGPLTNLSLPTFIILSTFARMPAILMSTITGDSMIRGNWILSLSLFLGMAVFGFLGIQLRERIIAKYKH